MFHANHQWHHQWHHKSLVASLLLVIFAYWLNSAQPALAQTCQNQPTSGTPSMVLSALSMPQNSPDNALIGTINVLGADPCATFSYVLTNDAAGRFQIDGNKLELISAGTLNYNHRPKLYITIYATDGANLNFSQDFTLGVLPPPPALTSQPVSTTIRAGQFVELDATATGAEPLFYQWYQGQTGDTSHPLVGAHTGRLTLPDLGNTGSYWLQVANIAGSANSQTAQITVNRPPIINAQPPTLTINRGRSASLSVSADGNAPLVYQWYQGQSGDTSQPIAGATNPFLITPALNDNTAYWVYITNEIGEINSQTAQITINQPPSITQQPVTTTNIVVGQPVTLTVAASGTSPFFYQWYSGQAGDVSQPITDAIHDSYVSPPLQKEADYWVRITNLAGNADSQTAHVIANQPPNITNEPTNPLLNPGQSATISVTVEGTPPFTYQWYVGATADTSQPIAGATAITYTTPSLKDTTNYWVRVKGPGGQADSQAALVAVNQPPKFNEGPDGTTIKRGQLATLTVDMGGAQPFSYQWYLGKAGDTSHPITDTDNPSFISPALTGDADYWVQVSNVAGQTNSTTAHVTVNFPPSIATQPISTTIYPSQTTTLKVVASGTGPLVYQWYQGVAGDISQPIRDYNDPAFTTPALQADTPYWVRVSGPGGIANSQTALVSVGQPPSLTAQPLSATIDLSGTAILTVTATGPTLIYQWYIGDSGDTSQPITGTTTASFTSSALTTTTTYWVRVSNDLGKADSQAAVIKVNPAPPPPTAPPPKIVELTPGSLSDSVMQSVLSLWQTYNDRRVGPDK